MVFKFRNKHLICIVSIALIIFIDYKIYCRCTSTKNMIKEIHIFRNNRLLTSNELLPKIDLYIDDIKNKNSAFRLKSNVTDKDLRYFIEGPPYRLIRVFHVFALTTLLSGVFVEVFNILDYI